MRIGWYTPDIEREMYAHHSQRVEQPLAQAALTDVHSELSRSLIVESIARIVAAGIVVAVLFDQLRNLGADTAQETGASHA